MGHRERAKSVSWEDKYIRSAVLPYHRQIIPTDWKFVDSLNGEDWDCAGIYCKEPDAARGRQRSLGHGESHTRGQSIEFYRNSISSHHLALLCAESPSTARPVLFTVRVTIRVTVRAVHTFGPVRQTSGPIRCVTWRRAPPPPAPPGPGPKRPDSQQQLQQPNHFPPLHTLLFRLFSQPSPPSAAPPDD